VDLETELLWLRTKLGTALRWSDFATLCHRPHSPNSAKPKCPWAGPRFRSKTRTAKWPTFVWHRSTGCIPMPAPVFGWLCPPNSCSTTRIDPRGQLDQLDRRDRWGRLLPLLPFQLVPLDLYHPVHLLVPVDLGGPPPHWNNSKWFYLLNIQNTWMTMMTFVIYIYIYGLCDIFMCYKKCTFLTLTIASGRIKPNVVQCFIIFSRFRIIEIKTNVPVFEWAEMHVRDVLHLR
jgi:hypothetical protein